MKFEPGRFYRTRGGFRAVYVGMNAIADDRFSKHIFATEVTEWSVSDEGRMHERFEEDHDIIGEWQEPVTVTRWWFGYRTTDGYTAAICAECKEFVEKQHRESVSMGHRVGPIEEITTVVP